MKKIVFLLITLSVSFFTYSQVYKSGPITSPETWSGTVYLSDDVTIISVVTINAGARILFKGNDVKLIVDGSGSINANGASGNEILFSADEDEDGNYGETGERGLKVKFYPTSSSKGTSSLGYCIFEYIDCSLATGGDAYGSLDAFGGTITISNSIIRNCKSDYGGAIFIRSGTKLTLDKCTIENNSADNMGGALYFGASSGTIKNCIFRNNSAPYGGGIYVYAGGPVIQNSLIYSNTSSTRGSGIFLNQANSGLNIINTTCAKNSTSGTVKDFQFSGVSGQLPKIINSIIWGSDIGTLDAARITVISSAIQGFTNAGDHTSCISLSSNNVDTNGPNFNATDGSDWSIKFSSPCRDAGTNSYGSPNIVPALDYIGSSRILTTDIGAYEVQYSRWKTTAGTTDWNTGDNWDGGVPSLTRDVIIPTGAALYPTSAPGPDLTIGSGKQMIIEPGARVTLDDLTNNGTLKMNANADGLSSLILNSYTKGAGATEDIQLRITGGYVGDPEYNQGKWHFISSPVQYFPIDPIFTTTTYNLAQWVDGIQGAQSIREGWVAYDGYMYITGGFNSDYEFSDLTPGKGYNLWYDNDTIYSLSGILNTGAINVTLDFAGDTAVNGYNLLGNPFTSGIDWDYIVESTAYPDSTSQGIAFNKDGQHYYYIAGVMVPDNGETPSGVIPPMQGFFVKTYAKDRIISLTTDARSHDDIWPRFKGTSDIPLLRLSISENEFSDETVVRFAEKAKTGLDYSYDAVKMFIPDNRPALYTLAGNYKFSINGQPFLEPESLIEIPLSVKVNSDGNHTITLKSIQVPDDYDLFLVDKTTGFEADLGSTSSLSFSSAAGLINNRFVIRISNITSGIEIQNAGDNQFNIYNGFGQINIQTLADEWDGKTGSVKIMDMTGKIITEKRNTGFSKTSLIQVREPATDGLYFVEIKSGLRRYVGKVVVK